MATPNHLQQVTTITSQEGEPVVLTSRNDNLLNAYNPVQLSAWRANVVQYIMSRNKVIKYVAKYATKSEPRSQETCHLLLMLLPLFRASRDFVVLSLDGS